MHEADCVQPLLVLRAGGGEHVAIARGVHDHLGEDGLAARFALQHDATHRIAVHDHIGHPAVEEHLHARFRHHFVHHHLGDFRIGGRVGLAGGVVGGGLGVAGDAA